MASWAVLFVAAMLGGAVNSVAGGGSFLTFPALVVSGVPPVIANATSTVALWPGSVASAGAYRREVASAPHVWLLSVMSLIGGAFGAWLLLHTPPATFTHLIPYLMLVATALFAFGGTVAKQLRGTRAPGSLTGRGRAGLALGQLVIATYGGFFGGGIGILMLAVLALVGLEDIHVMNGIKTVQAGVINGIAVLTFIVAGKVVWPQAVVMLVGAMAGGYLGAWGARRLQVRVVRTAVLIIACTMTAYFFVRG